MSEAGPKPAQASFGKLPDIAAPGAMHMTEGALVRPPTPGVACLVIDKQAC